MLDLLLAILLALSALGNSGADTFLHLGNCPAGWEVHKEVTFEDGSHRMVLRCDAGDG